MARERMVTRTVTVTTIEAICMDITTVETSINTYELSGSYAIFEQALKALKKAYETDIFKVVAIQSMSENEVLYGMSELEFIQLAKVLPPRGTKVEDEVPAQVEDEVPAQVEDEVPAQVEDEAPAQVEDEAPAQVEDEAPAQVEDEAPAKKRSRKSSKATK